MPDLINRMVLYGMLVVGLCAFGASMAPHDGWAQDATAGAFARNGFSARGMAMGNALAGDLSGDVSPYYNPALAPNATGQNIALSAALLTMDRELQFVQFATPIRPAAGLAIGLIHAGVSNIDGRNDDGRHTGDLSTDEFAVFMAFGNRFSERFAAGVALKFYRADFFERVEAAQAFGIDFGATYRVSDALHLGFAVNDLLASYEWNTSDAFEGGRTTSDPFPTRLRLGAAYAMQGGRLRLVAEYESRFASLEQRTRETVLIGSTLESRLLTEDLLVHQSRGRIGAEYALIDMLRVRAGLNRIGTDGTAGLRPSAGFGLDWALGNLQLNISYAVVLEPYVNDAMNVATLRLYL